MQNLLFLVPLLPLVSSLILLLLAGRLTPLFVAILGVGSVGLAAILTLFIGIEFVNMGGGSFQQVLFNWLPIRGASLNFGLHLDQLSLVMMAVITGVGWLIHWYAAAYMFDDKDVQRFFVYMNLFVFAMLMLVLGDSLVLLYLGWEGVGLCSFLLIGFWQHKTDNVLAAKKAFIVTRVGDTAMMIGLLILFSEFGSLHITTIVDSTAQVSQSNLWLACLLLVGGAVGKSAQLPLQTWLPDAMAGPTPVSALIHAATMVTAGVYLIARMHPLFLQVQGILNLVAWIGALTLVLAGIAALAQTDLKRILAYSTMSQIGYMFLGLGALAFDSAIFHLMTHAFFKALLFLTAGSIILKMHHQQDIFKMGGLFKSLPLTSTFLLIGLLALVAFPGSSGFFSKEAILAATYEAHTAGPILWWIGVLGAFLTSLYSFRLLFIVCFGPANHDLKEVDYKASSQLVVPLLPLVTLAVIGGFISLDFSFVFGPAHHPHLPLWIEWMPVAVALLGFILAWVLYFPRISTQHNDRAISQFCRDGLGFDWLYEQLFTKPLQFFARINKSDAIDHFYHFVGWFNFSLNEILVISQNGKLRWYLFGTLAGCALMLGGLLWWS
ncbi:NADH-quinone oxidoreductase subunit L [uncultured Paraglaciecola sp.]|uniref:NADH-quinone oxidoreductase subunit L n=1 Tax=uncultured Paraglaciecola sp. TaxID=1765024 RepID=UPI0030D97F94|tara:strand:- start:177367 stop:179187 length:1821 start_codon:yes stop_codon:yes gene_type:complete